MDASLLRSLPTFRVWITASVVPSKSSTGMVKRPFSSVTVPPVINWSSFFTITLSAISFSLFLRIVDLTCPFSTNCASGNCNGVKGAVEMAWLMSYLRHPCTINNISSSVCFRGDGDAK